jgi:hypothetical protein
LGLSPPSCSQGVTPLDIPRVMQRPLYLQMGAVPPTCPSCSLWVTPSKRMGRPLQSPISVTKSRPTSGVVMCVVTARVLQALHGLCGRSR